MSYRHPGGSISVELKSAAVPVSAPPLLTRGQLQRPVCDKCLSNPACVRRAPPRFLLMFSGHLKIAILLLNIKLARRIE